MRVLVSNIGEEDATYINLPGRNWEHVLLHSCAEEQLDPAARVVRQLFIGLRILWREEPLSTSPSQGALTPEELNKSSLEKIFEEMALLIWCVFELDAADDGFRVCDVVGIKAAKETCN